MNSETFVFHQVGNCWKMENSDIFIHLPFLKNSSNGYLKRVFKTDFSLNLTDENIQKLKNPEDSPITIEKF
jgi:hypothetical protein